MAVSAQDDAPAAEPMAAAATLDRMAAAPSRDLRNKLALHRAPSNLDFEHDTASLNDGCEDNDAQMAAALDVNGALWLAVQRRVQQIFDPSSRQLGDALRRALNAQTQHFERELTQARMELRTAFEHQLAAMQAQLHSQLATHRELVAQLEHKLRCSEDATKAIEAALCAQQQALAQQQAHAHQQARAQQEALTQQQAREEQIREATDIERREVWEAIEKCRHDLTHAVRDEATSATEAAALVRREAQVAMSTATQAAGAAKLALRRLDEIDSQQRDRQLEETLEREKAAFENGRRETQQASDVERIKAEDRLAAREAAAMAASYLKQLYSHRGGFLYIGGFDVKNPPTRLRSVLRADSLCFEKDCAWDSAYCMANYSDATLAWEDAKTVDVEARVKPRVYGAEMHGATTVLVTGVLPTFRAHQQQCGVKDDESSRNQYEMLIKERLRMALEGYEVTGWGKRTEGWGFTLIRFASERNALAFISDFDNRPVATLYGEGDNESVIELQRITTEDAASLTRAVRRIQAAAFDGAGPGLTKTSVLVTGLRLDRAKFRTAGGSFSDEKGAHPVEGDAEAHRLLHNLVAVARDVEDCAELSVSAEWYGPPIAGLAVITYDSVQRAWSASVKLDGSIVVVNDTESHTNRSNLIKVRAEKIYKRDQDETAALMLTPDQRKVRLRRKLIAAIKVQACIMRMSKMSALTKSKVQSQDTALNVRLERLESSLKDVHLKADEIERRQVIISTEEKAKVSDEPSVVTSTPPMELLSERIQNVERAFKQLEVRHEAKAESSELSALREVTDTAFARKLDTIVRAVYFEHFGAPSPASAPLDDNAVFLERLKNLGLLVETGDGGLAVARRAPDEPEEVDIVDRSDNGSRPHASTTRDYPCDDMALLNKLVELNIMRTEHVSGGGVYYRASLVPDDVSAWRASAQARLDALEKQMPAFAKEQRHRWHELWRVVTQSLSRIALFEERLAKFNASLETKTAHEQVSAMLRSLEASIRSQYDDPKGVRVVLERLREEVSRKTSQIDVSRIVEAELRNAEERLAKATAGPLPGWAQAVRPASATAIKPRPVIAKHPALSPLDHRKATEAALSAAASIRQEVTNRNHDSREMKTSRGHEVAHSDFVSRETAAQWAAAAVTSVVLGLPLETIASDVPSEVPIPPKLPIPNSPEHRVKPVYQSVPHHLVLASYPHGRPGALRALHQRSDFHAAPLDRHARAIDLCMRTTDDLGTLSASIESPIDLTNRSSAQRTE